MLHIIYNKNAWFCGADSRRKTFENGTSEDREGSSSPHAQREVVPFQKVGVFRKYDTKDGFRKKHVQSKSSAKTLSKDLFKDSLIKHQPNSRSLPPHEPTILFI